MSDEPTWPADRLVIEFTKSVIALVQERDSLRAALHVAHERIRKLELVNQELKKK